MPIRRYSHLSLVVLFILYIGSALSYPIIGSPKQISLEAFREAGVVPSECPIDLLTNKEMGVACGSSNQDISILRQRVASGFLAAAKKNGLKVEIFEDWKSKGANWTISFLLNGDVVIVLISGKQPDFSVILGVNGPEDRFTRIEAIAAPTPVPSPKLSDVRLLQLSIRSLDIDTQFDWGVLSISPDGQIFAIFTTTTGISLFDTTTAKLVLNWKTLLGKPAGLFFAQNGQSLIAVTEQGLVSTFETSSGKLVRKFQVPVSDLGGLSGSGIDDVALDPSGKLLAIADNNCAIYELSSGKKLISLPDDCKIVAWSPDSNRVAVSLSGGLSDDEIQLIDLVTGKAVRRLSVDGALTYAVAYSPDGRFIAAVSGAGVVTTWDASSGHPIFARQLGALGAIGGRIAFTPDGRTLVVKLSLSAIVMLDTSTGDVFGKIDLPLASSSLVEGIVFSSSGAILVATRAIVSVPTGFIEAARQGNNANDRKNLLAKYLIVIDSLCSEGKLLTSGCLIARSAIRDDRIADYPTLRLFLEGQLSETEFLKFFP